MGEVDGFSEASAVHLGIEDDQRQGQKREEGLERHGCNACRLSPYTSDEGGSQYGFGKGKAGSENLGRETEKSHVQEVKVFSHDQTCAYRVHEFEYSTDEEYKACDEAAEALQSEKKIPHFYFIAESTTVLILSKIALGGSICPFSSEQSMRMKRGSSSHCLL